jgi:hypothetical protein
MNPITWQNINGPSLSEASRPLDSAARAFDMGFGALRQTLDQHNQIDSQNFQTGIKNNTNTVLNKLMGIEDIDAFKAAKQGLGATLDGYGAGIDQDRIRQFADQRVSTLQDRAVKDIGYQHTVLDEAQAKDRDRIAGMIASGDKTMIEAAMKELPNMDLRVKADLYRNGNDAARQIIDRAHADESHTWAGQMNRAQISHMANQDVVARGQLGVAQGQLGVSKGQLAIQQAQAMSALDDKLTQRELDLRNKRAATFANDASSQAGQERIEDTLKAIEDPKDRKQARLALAQAQLKYPNAPTSVLQQVARGIDADYAMDYFVRSGAVSDVGKAMKNYDASGEAKNALEQRTQLDALIAGTQARRNKIPALFGGTGTGAGDVEISGTAADPKITTKAGTGTSLSTPAQEQAAKAALSRAAPPSADDSDVAPTGAKPVTTLPLTSDELATKARNRMSIADQVRLAQQDQQANNRSIEVRMRNEELAKAKATLERQLATNQLQIEAYSKVPKNNPNGALLLQRAQLARQELLKQLGQ